MNPRHVRWLYDELPGLVSAGVLTEEVATGLRAHYGSPPPAAGISLAKIFLGIFGAMLIGSGIILTLASNWDELGRPTRAVLSFLPLLLGQALAAWTLAKRMDSTAWREASSAFLAMAIGASIALVGQTYHLPGDLPSFLLTWTLLSLPLVYIYRSATATMLYLIGATCWSIAAQSEGGHALWYWPLFVAVVPLLWWEHHRDAAAPRNAFLAWVCALALCVGLGVSLERVLPGLWIVAYAALLGAFSLLGRESLTGPSGGAFRVVGGVGTVVLALLLTFEFPWDDIGFHHYRHGNTRYMEWAGYGDFALALGLLAVAAALAVRCGARRDWGGLVWAVSPVLAVVAFALASIAPAASDDIPARAAYNLFLFVLGGLVLRAGLIEGKFRVANAGLGILALLFTFRFFDGNMGILTRGIAFILIGAGFLAVNLWLSKRAPSPREEQV